MNPLDPPEPPAPPGLLAQHSHRAGDLVVSQAGYPILYAILEILAGDRLRVRGQNWEPSRGAVMLAGRMRPATRTPTTAAH